MKVRSEGGDAGDRAAHDQGMDVVRALIGCMTAQDRLAS
jgi:hypothetical protein